MSKTAIVWFRRDLRLTDNPALLNAVNRAERVIPLYIHTPEEEAPWQPGAASNWWLHHSLASLDSDLHKAGSGLVIRKGPSSLVLASLCRDYEVSLVCWNRRYEPAVMARDKSVAASLAAAGRAVNSHPGSVLREPGTVLKKDGGIYRVYTPFSKQYFLDGPAARPAQQVDVMPPLPEGIESVPLQALSLLPAVEWYGAFGKHWRPGEAGAITRLRRFIDSGAAAQCDKGRNIPSDDGVSALSPHLHFGEISPRQVWYEVLDSADFLGEKADIPDNVKSYLRQIVWREFAIHLLYHLPHTAEQPFNERFRDFEWEDNPELLEAWQLGQTGIPMVDAGMRQLWQTGYMHNRLRMLVASVLTKNGLVHWLEGARWFWDTLVDADLANNSLGWQWVAGCGADAAPYFRIFSPSRQGRQFDRQGKYVRTWVPELARLPARYMHEPWRAPASVLSDAGITLGREYPCPVVDLAASRTEALRRFRALR